MDLPFEPRSSQASCRRAIRLKEEEYRFHVSLAQSLALNGETGEAQQSLERAKELAPSRRELDAINLTELGSL